MDVDNVAMSTPGSPAILQPINTTTRHASMDLIRNYQYTPPTETFPSSARGLLWLSKHSLPSLEALTTAYFDDDEDVFRILIQYAELCVELDNGETAIDVPVVVATLYMEKFYCVSALEKVGGMLFFRDTITEKVITTIVGSVGFEHVARWQASSYSFIRAAFVVAAIGYKQTGATSRIRSK